MERGAGARGTRIPHAPILTLPNEVLTSDIFLRLPAKALIRCRAVCRSWRDFISAPEFLLAYHQRQPSLPLAVFLGQPSPCSRGVADAAVDAFDLRQFPAKRQPVLRFNDYSPRRQFFVHDSRDGLILLSLSNGWFYICNPATRQWCTLPSLNGTYVVGMYPHSTSGEFRILHRKWGHQVGSDAFYVLTVGSEEPRCLGSVESLSATGSVAYLGSCVPVLLHSCLHWSQSNLADGLIVFDTNVESFRFIRAPAADVDALAGYRLLEIDGMLGIGHVTKTETAVEIWVLQDYKEEVWSLKCNIRLPVAQMRCIAQQCWFEVLLVSEDGSMLIQCNSERRLFHCDHNGVLLQRWDHRQLPMVAGHWYKESLASHSFFPRHGRRVKQPRFFSGLV